MSIVLSAKMVMESFGLGLGNTKSLRVTWFLSRVFYTTRFETKYVRNLSYPFWLVGVHQTHLIAGHSSWRFDVFLRVRQFFVKRKYSITTPTKTHPTTPLFRTCRQLTLVGRPHLKTAEIHTTVEEHFHEMQMPVYKRRRRKSSQCSASDRQVRSLIFKSFFRCTVWRCLQTGCDWTANSDLRDWRHQFMKATNRATFNWGQCLRT